MGFIGPEALEQEFFLHKKPMQATDSTRPKEQQIYPIQCEEPVSCEGLKNKQQR